MRKTKHSRKKILKNNNTFKKKKQKSKSIKKIKIKKQRKMKKKYSLKIKKQKGGDFDPQALASIKSFVKGMNPTKSLFIVEKGNSKCEGLNVITVGGEQFCYTSSMNANPDDNKVTYPVNGVTNAIAYPVNGVTNAIAYPVNASVVQSGPVSNENNISSNTVKEVKAQITERPKEWTETTDNSKKHSLYRNLAKLGNTSKKRVQELQNNAKGKRDKAVSKIDQIKNNTLKGLRNSFKKVTKPI